MFNKQDEEQLRRKLGIPPEAEHVLVFGETSHWDPNWLHTTEEYYEGNVRQVIDRAIEQLVQQPRRVFAIESLFFLQRYWERNPDNHAVLRQLLESARLRLTGSGITTPDTVLPDAEAIIRDYLYGQQWLRDHQIAVEPTVAYLPDDFGHSPALPSILRALGCQMAAITRIDGMYFVAADYRSKRAFPLPGSSAELLQRQHKTLDFTWRAPDGAEVLCHWNAFTYFQGDMLAHLGIIRWMGTCFGVSCRTDRHIARRVRSYVKQLRPLSQTPYMYCPIGCDFNEPIDDLVGLLDRHNDRWYPRTGVWVVNAGLDDYLQLVSHHRDRLPTLELDPNPYWMGFYSSRPEAKRRCNRTARKLVLAEKLSAVEAATNTGPSNGLQQDIREAWDMVVLSNHHDFITGTSPDRIWLQEQQPWLQTAEALADRSLRSARAAHPPCQNGEPDDPPTWELRQGRLEVVTRDYRAVIDEQRGGCLVSFRIRGEDRELLSAPANDLVVYADSGGLWRMGHEYLGGRFDELCASNDKPASIWAAQRGGVLEVQVVSKLAGRRFVRWLWFRNGSPIVRMRLHGAAPRRRTITCRFPTTITAADAVMDVPGGVVRRPPHKLYSPTFWPARSFVHLHNADEQRTEHDQPGVAGFVGGPASIAASPAGELQWVAFRYAPNERAFGVLPLLAHPASGTAPDEGAFDYALWFTRSGDYRANKIAQHVRGALRSALFGPGAPDVDLLANSIVVADNPDVLVSALKPASHGAGVIARLFNPTNELQHTALRCPSRIVIKATLCDGLERDQAPLAVSSEGVVTLRCAGSISSVRLEF